MRKIITILLLFLLSSLPLHRPSIGAKGATSNMYVPKMEVTLRDTCISWGADCSKPRIYKPSVDPRYIFPARVPKTRIG